MTILPTEILKWHILAGVDETTQTTPRNYFTNSNPAPIEKNISPVLPFAESMAKKPSPLLHAPLAAAAEARSLADAADSLEALEVAVRDFDGCGLKSTATHTVFADGNKQANILLIGEAPGAEEDKQGIPFCGPSGKLLDKMLASIHLHREHDVLISNTVYWRPPGNRQPSPEELAVCQPFVEKFIALMQPKLLILCGGTAVLAMLAEKTPMSRLRGRFHDYTNPYLDKTIPSGVIYHPSYLMRSPGQKRLAWEDMLLIEGFLADSK